MTIPNKTTSGEGLAVSAPPTVQLTTAHPWGPLAGSRPGSGGFDVHRVPLAGVRREELGKPPSAPIRRAGEGTATGATLRACFDDPADSEGGQVVDVELTVDGDLSPGSYASELLISSAGGEPLLRVPVSLAVRASWIWPVAFLLLGLITLGVIVWLADEGQLRDERARLLERQRDFDEMVERSLAREIDALLVRRTEAEFDRAVATLDSPRAWTLRDDRIARAERHKETTERMAEQLRTRWTGHGSGAVAAERTQAAWNDLDERLKATLELRPEEPSANGAGEAIASVGLDGFLRQQFRVHVDTVVLVIRQTLKPEVERVARAASAGEQERARRLAATTLRQIQRAARWLDGSVKTYRTGWQLAGQLAALDSRVDEALRNPDLDPAARKSIRQRLITARRILREDDPLHRFPAAHRQLREALVEAAAGSQKGLLERLQRANDEAVARTSLVAIGAAMEGFDPEASEQEKRRAVSKTFDLWRERIGIVPDGELRQRLAERIETSERQYLEGDRDAAVEGIGELFESWSEFEEAEIRAARVSVLGPECRQQAAQMRNELASSGEQVIALGDHPAAPELDRQAESARQRIAEIDASTECYNLVVAASAEMIDLDERLLTVMLGKLSPSEELLAAAESSGSVAAVAVARRRLQRVLPLDLEVRTPRDQRVGEQSIAIEVGGLDPLWTAGTRLWVDFGDGSSPWTGTAEAIRQRPLLEHRYERPGSYHLEVRAVRDRGDSSVPAADPAADSASDQEPLGQGTASLEIAPDPVSATRGLADFFFNLRFLLALLVGLLIQGWRLQGDKPFGADRRDYLEVYAIGVASRAGVDGLLFLLPDLLR